MIVIRSASLNLCIYQGFPDYLYSGSVEYFLLCPLESAIVLDLLMSLPEELLLLDCNKLNKHLIQVKM